MNEEHLHHSKDSHHKVLVKQRGGKEWFILGTILFFVLITMIAHWPTRSSLLLHLAGALFIGYGFGYGLGASWESEGFGKVSKGFKIGLVVFFITIVGIVLAGVISAKISDDRFSKCISDPSRVGTCSSDGR